MKCPAGYRKTNDPDLVEKTRDGWYFAVIDCTEYDGGYLWSFGRDDAAGEPLKCGRADTARRAAYDAEQSHWMWIHGYDND